MTHAGVPGRVRPASASEPELGKFRVLAIDGGGIRGVIPAVLLADLEALLGSALASVRSDPAQASSAALWEGISEPRIADCFHLIAGTSTGGLLAAGLTNAGTDRRPKLSAADAVDAYKSHGKEIFHRSLLQSLRNPLNLLRPKYPLAQLRKVLEIRTVLGAGRLEDARTGVLIASYDLSVPGPRLFTRWGAPGAATTPAAPEETMVQAGLATAAAPTYFDPENLRGSRLVDGGIYAGNPALAAISMALRRTEEPR
ncbi:MAG: patatin-like phospholipase family protein, partial [Actinomycetota bacterium]|nr:patatin-like phospholipase family protein [Actinomycetota bacterium]